MSQNVHNLFAYFVLTFWLPCLIIGVYPERKELIKMNNVLSTCLTLGYDFTKVARNQFNGALMLEIAGGAGISSSDVLDTLVELGYAPTTVAYLKEMYT